MTLEHGFLLVEEKHHKKVASPSLPGSTDLYRLHDDLIQYMGDTLKWLPTTNPSRNEPGQGLNLYGRTVLAAAGASMAAKLFEGWAGLFRLGPQQLALTGDWSQIEGDPDSSGYERLHFDRDATVAVLEGIASICRRAASSKGKLVVVHLGI